MAEIWSGSKRNSGLLQEIQSEIIWVREISNNGSFEDVKLKQRGILTEEEYEKLKGKILNSQ